MKILLTGSNGYIGKDLHNKLCKLHTIVRGVRTSLSSEDESVRIINFKTGQGMENACVGVDCVIHCAYDSKDHSSNLDAVRFLLKALCNSNVKKLILFGTFATYDNSSQNGINENTHKSPWNFKYTSVKTKIEDLLREYVKTTNPGLDVVYLEPAIVTDGEGGGGWGKFRSRLREYEKIALPCDGLGMFNYITRDELSKVIINAIEIKKNYFKEARDGYIKCLISGESPKTWREWILEDEEIEPTNIISSNGNQLHELYLMDIILSMYYGRGRGFFKSRRLPDKILGYSKNNYYSSGLDRITLQCVGSVDVSYAKYLGLI